MPPLISIVIPTYNEEKYLPKLLESLKAQSFKSFEVIVADWKSSDRTVEIARSFGARVVKCRRRGIGPGRNEGARVARGRLLVFADADVVFKDVDLLKKIWEKYRQGYLSGTAKLRNYDLPRYLLPFQNVFDTLAFLYLKVRYLYPGAFSFIDKKLFWSMGGFSNTYSEDLEFSRRLAKVTNLNFFEDLEVWVSGRRYRAYGLFSTLIYYVFRDLATALKKSERFGHLFRNRLFEKLYSYRKP